MVKEPACQCRRCRKRRFDPWAGKIPWRRNGNQLQCSCLGNPVDKGDWWATVQGGHKRVGHGLVTKQQNKWIYRY